jgi:uncharacterized protein YbbK (DUF523 family)
MDKHFASLTGAFRSARSKAEKVVGDALLKEKLSFALEVGREVTTNLSATAAGALKCVREYDLSDRAVASAGPGCLFAIHDGTRKSKTKASLLVNPIP